MASTETVARTTDGTLEAWRWRVGKLGPGQITAWRAMTPAQRLYLACQAYPSVKVIPFVCADGQ